MMLTRLQNVSSKFFSMQMLLVAALLSSGCESGHKWADQAESLRGHNTPRTWVRTPAIGNPEVSPAVSVLRKGQAVSFKTFAEALKSYREGDEIKLRNGVYPLIETVTVSHGINRVLISGLGHESIIVFVKNAPGKLFTPGLVTHAPMTFRDVQLVDPVITSTTGQARLWFEGSYVSGRFTHFGTELMGSTAGQIFILGGYYSIESAFGRAPPREFVESRYPNYLFSTVYTPNLARENTHYAVVTLRSLDKSATVSPALFNLGKEVSKLRAEGGYGMPSEAVMNAAISEIYATPRAVRLAIHPNYGAAWMIQAGNNVTLEAYNRLASYLYSKLKTKTEIPLPAQTLTALEKAKMALKGHAPVTALLLATQYEVPKFHPRYKELESVVEQARTSLQSQHGCKISIDVKGAVSREEFHPTRTISHLRESVSSLYPVAYIDSATKSGCNMVTDVYRSVFRHWKSIISTTITSTMVETDEARRARETALAANSRDVWKEAFSTVGNASMNAGARSRQVWQNQEKTRTRVEERASGTYLVYFKGNPNLPPSSIGSGADKMPEAESGGGVGANVPGGMREKKTVRSRYYLYGLDEVDYEVSVMDGGQLAAKFERTKHRTESKRGPCESESVDGWSASLISGDCFITGLPRSNQISRAMNDAWVAFVTTNRLPKVVARVREMYAKPDRLQQSEAALVAALYGGIPEGKGLEAIRAETEGIYKIPTNAGQIPSDLATTLSLSNLL